jgi:Predicted transcriptional regulators
MSESHLAKKLIHLRQKNNYTQKYLGDYLNITRQGYAHYERGDRNPDYQSLLKLANLYTISLDDLLIPTDDSSIVKEATDYNQKLKDNKQEALSAREKELLDLFAQLPVNEQEDFVSYLKVKIQNNCTRNN